MKRSCGSRPPSKIWRGSRMSSANWPRQVAALKTQARQAVRYRNISGQVRRTEALLFHLRWIAAQAEVGDTGACQGRSRPRRRGAHRRAGAGLDAAGAIRRRTAGLARGGSRGRRRLAAPRRRPRNAGARGSPRQGTDRRTRPPHRAIRGRPGTRAGAGGGCRGGAATARRRREGACRRWRRETEQRLAGANERVLAADTTLAASEKSFAELTGALADLTARRNQLQTALREHEERADAARGRVRQYRSRPCRDRFTARPILPALAAAVAEAQAALAEAESAAHAAEAAHRHAREDDRRRARAACRRREERAAARDRGQDHRQAARGREQEPVAAGDGRDQRNRRLRKGARRRFGRRSRCAGRLVGADALGRRGARSVRSASAGRRHGAVGICEGAGGTPTPPRPDRRRRTRRRTAAWPRCSSRASGWCRAKAISGAGTALPLPPMRRPARRAGSPNAAGCKRSRASLPTARSDVEGKRGIVEAAEAALAAAAAAETEARARWREAQHRTDAAREATRRRRARDQPQCRAPFGAQGSAASASAPARDETAAAPAPKRRRRSPRLPRRRRNRRQACRDQRRHRARALGAAPSSAARRKRSRAKPSLPITGCAPSPPSAQAWNDRNDNAAAQIATLAQRTDEAANERAELIDAPQKFEAQRQALIGEIETAHRRTPRGRRPAGGGRDRSCRSRQGGAHRPWKRSAKRAPRPRAARSATTAPSAGSPMSSMKSAKSLQVEPASRGRSRRAQAGRRDAVDRRGRGQDRAHQAASASGSARSICLPSRNCARSKSSTRS